VREGCKVWPALLLMFSALAGRANGQASDWKQIPIPAMRAFHPQEPKRIQLPNGMVIFLQEDHELPLIDGIARIRGGSRDEPAAKTGMLDMYGEVWRTGGTKSQTGDQLDDFLEVRAAKVETNNNADSTTISWSCLKGDFKDVFKVFTDLLRDPEFRGEKLELAQKEMYDSISRRNDDVSEIAGRESGKLAYGSSNPYARQPEYATVSAVTRQDLLDWYQRYAHPNNIILGMVGDFDSTAVEAQLRQTFGGWEKGPAISAGEIQFHPAEPGYYLIPKTDVNQSSIRMVDLGIRRDSPDYYAAQVFNEAFGGGFSSRLFRNIRTVQGLAYDVGGGIGSSFDHPGVSRISMGTKSASTVEAIQAVYKQIDELKDNPISEEEIKRAKDSILNSFVFNFDSPEKVLRERMAYEFYRYPADFLERYRAGIEKVQRADLERVGSHYLHKDRLAVLVVGNEAEFDKPLALLGPVRKIDISIPPPPSAESPKPTASNAEGKSLAAKVVESMGGLTKLKAVKALRVDLNEKSAGGAPGTEVHVIIAFPESMHVEVQSPQGPLSIVVTPSAGFVSGAGMGVRDLPDSQKMETGQQIHRDLVYIGQHLDDPAFTFTAGGTEKINDTEARIVDVNTGDLSMRWYVDPASGHIVRETYEATGRTGPFQGETDLSDWKTTEGITLPTVHKNKQNGKDTGVVEVTGIQFNPPIDPQLFQKPADGTKPTP